jgi:hypothetical protein
MVTVLPGGRRMRAVVEFVAANPGCSKSDAGREGGTGAARQGSVERVITHGYVAAERQPGGRYQLQVTPKGRAFIGQARP